MREAMPQCAAWVDAMRDVFEHEFVTERIRNGLQDGTCWFAEGGQYVGRPGQPERDAERAAGEHRFTLDQIATGGARCPDARAELKK